MEGALVAGEDGKGDPNVDAGDRVFRWFDQLRWLTPNLSKCCWGEKKKKLEN